MQKIVLSIPNKHGILQNDALFTIPALALVNSLYVKKNTNDICDDWDQFFLFLNNISSAWKNVVQIEYSVSFANSEKLKILNEVRTFRAQLRDVLSSLSKKEKLSVKTMKDLNALFADMYITTRIQNNGTFVISILYANNERHIPLLFVFSTLLLLSNFSLQIKKCTNPDCVIFFIDTTGRRKWCSMSVCGNRAKVSTFTKRHK